MPVVFANSSKVGALTRDPRAHLFRYDKGIEPKNAVSLLMPTCSGEPIDFPASSPARLHPIFDMNLPEGSLRESIGRMFAKALPTFDDYALLSIVGRSQIGRLRYAQSREDLDRVPPPESVQSFLRTNNTHALFNELLLRYAGYSGISGVQPKLLVRDDGSLSTSKLSPSLKPGDRLTFPGSTHIIKTFDPEVYPDLAANEYVCLKAAVAAGLPTQEFLISDDMGLLAIRRFDLNPDGNYSALEDTCALAGRLCHEKYDGSYEQVAKTLQTVLRSPDGSGHDMRNFFKLLVLSVAVRNGDAHRKNFAVMYDDAVNGPIRLAPAYDLITTTAYLPKDTMALMFEGSKRWPDAKKLLKFGMTRCNLSDREARTAIEEVSEGIARTRADLGMIRDATLRQQMASIWEEGLAATLLRRSVRIDPPSE